MAVSPSVETSSLEATLVANNEGRLPRIATESDGDMSGQPGSYVAITQGDIKLLATVKSMREVPGENGNASRKSVKLIPLGEVSSGGVFSSGIKNYPVTGAEVHSVSKEEVEAIFVKFRAQGLCRGCCRSG